MPAQCPACSESIQPEARKCPHCGEWLQPEEAGPARGPSAAHRAMLGKYRQQMNALGGVNIVFALMMGGVASVIMEAQKQAQVQAQPLRVVIVAGFVSTLFVLGVFLLLKHSWAALVSLVFYVLFTLGSLIRFNVCGLILAGACILMSVRVYRLDRALRAQGIDPSA